MDGTIAQWLSTEWDIILFMVTIMASLTDMDTDMECMDHITVLLLIHTFMICMLMVVHIIIILIIMGLLTITDIILITTEDFMVDIMVDKEAIMEEM